MGALHPPTAVSWLRNDLRLADNPALAAACAGGRRTVAVFIHEADPSLRPIGAAARWWLHQSLEDLGRRLAGCGVPLIVESGPAQHVLRRVTKKHGAGFLYWNRRYDFAGRTLDQEIKADCLADGIEVRSFNGSLLVEPFDILTKQDTPYGVFTPFWKTLQQRQIASPIPAISGQTAIAMPPEGFDVSYAAPGWAGPLTERWSVGEAAAHQALHRFLDGEVSRYPEGRDVPALDATSSLSPHLRFGEISPRQIWHAATMLSSMQPRLAPAIDKFLSELAWREFSYNLLFHREDIASVPMQPRFAALPWRSDAPALEAWQRGKTGIPIVDAGMRQLWATGWMHNRVRMLTASLLSKNLLIDWRIGERWFWDTLVDADPASNPAGWQWVAGCGADAAPYFRIFNPQTQGERFDPDGAYVRRWVPELRRLPDAFIHRPADAPPPILAAADIDLGRTYPYPIVDLKATGARALAALGDL
jgi:deoxyribodipyrimidine photo-lyase